MSVDFECGLRGGVPQPGLHGLDVRPGRDQQRREIVPHIVQFGSTPSKEYTLPHPGKWMADDDGTIRCWEHNLTPDAH